MDSPRHELLAGVRDLLKSVRLVKSDLTAGHESVPTGAVGVLATIDAIGECHLKNLAVRCALDPSTVSRAVAELVRAGLVARSADPADGRACVLTVTSRGRQTLDDYHRRVDEHLAAALHAWEPEDVAALSVLLRRFATDLMTRTDRNLEVAR